MKVPYKEIFKLKVMLDKENIPYEFYDDSQNNAYLNGNVYIQYQIIVKEQNSDNELISVIEGTRTYGSNKDLLEIMGCLTEEEEKEDYVKGSLTAEEVLKKIKDRYFRKVQITDDLSIKESLNSDGSITIPKKVTLQDLEQNLINELNKNVKDLTNYKSEIELLKILLDH